MKVKVITSLAIYIIIPIILLFYAIGMDLMLNPIVSFSTFVYSSDSRDKITHHSSELYANKKISGGFYSNDDYLGMVRFNFNTFYRTNTDTIVFRLREKGSKMWYVENYYAVDRFSTGRQYPFGFPVIKNSKGKYYVFEIESLKGKKGNAIGLNYNDPVILTEYVYPKETYRGSILLFLNFTIKKIINSFSSLYFSPTLVNYLSPLIVYLISIIPIQYITKSLVEKSNLKNYIFIYILSSNLNDLRKDLITILFFILAMVSMLIEGDNTIPLMELYLCWVIVIIVFKIESFYSYAISMLLIVINILFLLIGSMVLSEKAVIIAYNLLIIAITQDVLKIFLKSRNKFRFVKIIRKKLITK